MLLRLHALTATEDDNSFDAFTGIEGAPDTKKMKAAKNGTATNGTTNGTSNGTPNGKAAKKAKA